MSEDIPAPLTSCLSLLPPSFPNTARQPYAVLILGLSYEPPGEKKTPNSSVFITPYLFFLLSNTGSVPCWAVGWDHLKFPSNKSHVPPWHLCCYMVCYHDRLETSLLSRDWIASSTEPERRKLAHLWTFFCSSLKDPGLHWQELLPFKNNSRKKMI